MTAELHDVVPVLERDLFIDGAWRPSSDGGRIAVVDPATESVVGNSAAATVADVDAAVAAARTAFDDGPWPRTTMAERVEVLLRFADELEADAEPVTEVLMAETGLIRSASSAGAGTMPWMIRYYAGAVEGLQLVEERVGLMGATVRIEKVPVGVVAAIIPWNSPLGLASFKLPQALLAGCTVIMKPSEVTPLSAGYVADAALRAGIPRGVLNVLPALPPATAHLVRHAGVDKISFTGSTEVGRAVAAGAADTLTPLTLELGGKSAALVLDDADLRRVVDTMVVAVTNNNGEVCTVPSRLLVPESRAQEIVSALVEAFGRVTVGAPSEPDSQVGPMVSEQHYEQVLAHLRSAVDEGGSFAVGGGRAEGHDKGYYIAPTIITGVSPQARVAQEEIFGPVLTVLTYRDEDEAIDIVNGTQFGLAGAVYSTDPGRALALARRFLSGTVTINSGSNIDPSVPFGGFKQSGYGRELGLEGLDAYLQTRAVFLDGEPMST